jgi:hypothetical protein
MSEILTLFPFDSKVLDDDSVIDEEEFSDQVTNESYNLDGDGNPLLPTISIERPSRCSTPINEEQFSSLGLEFLSSGSVDKNDVPPTITGPLLLDPSFWLLVLGYIQIFLCSGIVWGWGALQSVLIREGAFGDLCKEGEQFPCESQLAKLSLVFIMGSTGIYTSNIPFGLLLDKCGPKLTSCVAALVLSFGFALCMWDSYLILGFYCVGVAGPAVQISAFHVYRRFPHWTGRLLQIATACFDASSLVFTLLGFAYQDFGLSRRELFLCSQTAPVFIFLTSFMFWDRLSFSELQRQSEAGIQSKDSSAPLLAEEPDVLHANTIADKQRVFGDGDYGTPSRVDGLHSGLRSSDLLSESLGGRFAPPPAAASINSGGQDGGLLVAPLELPGKGPSGGLVKSPALAAGLPRSNSDHAGKLAAPPPSRSRSMRRGRRLPPPQQPLWSQVVDARFLYLLVFSAVHSLRINMAIGTLNAQLAVTHGPARADQLSRLCSVILPFGFVVRWLSLKEYGKCMGARVCE